MPEKRGEYLARATSYALIGLSSILGLGACTSNPTAIEKSEEILNIPPKSFSPRKTILPKELEIYQRGPQVVENADGYLLSYPIAYRDVSRLAETLTKMCADCLFTADQGTNQLIVRVPYLQKTDSARDGRLKEVRSFIESLDKDLPQYQIQAYSMTGTAKQLERVRSSLDLLVESGDVGLALNSRALNNGPQDRGIQHTITGILDSSLPTVQLSALFNGLEHHGYVTGLSSSSAIADEREPAEIKRIRKIPIPKIYPVAPAPIIGFEYMEVTNSLKVIPSSRANGIVEIDLEAVYGNLVPSAINHQSQVPLHDISSRTTKSKLRVPLGRLVLFATTLEDQTIDVDESSPISRIIGSESLKDSSRMHELTALVVNRVDPASPSTGWPVEELERKLNNNK